MRTGDGLLAIWNDVRAGDEAGFVEWHSREHIPERIGISGFTRGRRLYGASAKPRWITLYEAGSAEAFESEAYLERLSNPTPWTRSILPTFLATERMISSVVASSGEGRGGALAVLRLWGGGEAHDDTALRYLAANVAAKREAIACVVARSTGVRQETEEKRLRSGDQEAPDLVVLAELYMRDGGDWRTPQAMSDFAPDATRRQLDIYIPEYELTAS